MPAQGIHPAFEMARQRAERYAAMFGHAYLNYPAIARKGKPLPPDVELPAEPEPAREGLPPIPGWNRDTAVLVASAAAAVAMLFIEV